MQEISEVNRKIAEAKSEAVKDQHLFSDSTDFISKKQHEIASLQRECEQLQHRNFQISAKADMAKELNDDLNKLKIERDQIEKSIT